VNLVDFVIGVGAGVVLTLVVAGVWFSWFAKGMEDD
jgi:hypothetical protein